MYAYRIDGFEYHEAVQARDYCRCNVHVQKLYLDDERKRNPLSDHEYSKWKLKEARTDLREAERRVKAFSEPHLKLTGES